MTNFLITHHGLILEKYSKVRYTLNSYLLSTEFCANLICFNAHQIDQFIAGHSYMYVTSKSANNWNPHDHYCSQIKYMHELSDIESLSEKLINLSFKYALYTYDNVLVLTYPE